jgi:hypothetical protein
MAAGAQCAGPRVVDDSTRERLVLTRYGHYLVQGNDGCRHADKRECEQGDRQNLVGNPWLGAAVHGDADCAEHQGVEQGASRPEVAAGHPRPGTMTA